jgi:hypothetical protein
MTGQCLLVKFYLQLCVGFKRSCNIYLFADICVVMNLKNYMSVLAPAFFTMSPSSGQLKRTREIDRETFLSLSLSLSMCRVRLFELTARCWHCRESGLCWKIGLKKQNFVSVKKEQLFSTYLFFSRAKNGRFLKIAGGGTRFLVTRKINAWKKVLLLF